MSLILAGTFAPWSPTARMIGIFTKQRLKKLRDSLKKKIDMVDIDDECIQRSIRHRNNIDVDDVIQALGGLKDTRLRTLFQLMIEELPDKEQVEMSEETLVTNHVSPVLRAFAHDPANEIFSHLLSRFGTSALNEGAPVVPLIQVTADRGVVYRHFVKARGIIVLAEVGVFWVPVIAMHLGALQATLPALYWFRNCLKWLEEHPNSLKKSWTSTNLLNIEKYVN
ncbi:hypothetical protein BGX27_003392 [Mortierella sp. AM989]|nr:hypothetical protein BGX27_003392 [Mortierella sp. AM989]